MYGVVVNIPALHVSRVLYQILTKSSNFSTQVLHNGAILFLHTEQSAKEITNVTSIP